MLAHPQVDELLRRHRPLDLGQRWVGAVKPLGLRTVTERCVILPHAHATEIDRSNANPEVRGIGIQRVNMVAAAPFAAERVARDPGRADQIQQVLGSGPVQALAQKLGISPEQASSTLSQLLPTVVDKLSPNGTLPDHSSLLQMGESILSSLGKTGTQG